MTPGPSLLSVLDDWFWLAVCVWGSARVSTEVVSEAGAWETDSGGVCSIGSWASVLDSEFSLSCWFWGFKLKLLVSSSFAGLASSACGWLCSPRSCDGRTTVVASSATWLGWLANSSAWAGLAEMEKTIPKASKHNMLGRDSIRFFTAGFSF